MPSERAEAVLKRATEEAWLAYPASQSGRTYYVAGAIVIATLGTNWFDRHINTQAAKTDFFRNDALGDPQRELDGFMRVIRLGEMIYNLLDVGGFRHVLNDMRTKNPEPTFAEMEAASILFHERVPFYFKVPEGELGSDYDLEILVQGVPVCAEVKCRIEISEPNSERLIGRLKAAQAQLPADRPGVIMCKLPAPWIHDLSDARGVRAMESAAESFLRQTERVVSVICWHNVAKDFGGLDATLVLLREFLNPTHRFDRSHNWKVLGPEVSNVIWTNLATVCA